MTLEEIKVKPILAYRGQLETGNYHVMNDNGEALVVEIPKTFVVFPYHDKYETITFHCNSFVVDYMNKLVAKLQQETGYDDIVCMKEYKGNYQLSVKLKVSVDEVKNLQRSDNVGVFLECNGLKRALGKHYLSWRLVAIRKIGKNQRS